MKNIITTIKKIQAKSKIENNSEGREEYLRHLDDLQRCSCITWFSFDDKRMCVAFIEGESHDDQTFRSTKADGLNLPTRQTA